MLDKMVEQLEVLGLDYVIRVLPWMLKPELCTSARAG